MATVTKRELISELSDRAGITQSEAARYLEALIDVVIGRLGVGDEVTFRRFGAFEVRVSKAKLGRNPSQPEMEVLIPERCSVRFRPGKELKEKLASLGPSAIKISGNRKA